MSQIQARVEGLRELVDELKNVETLIERAALFAAIRGLVEDLENDEKLNGYAKEKAFQLRLHSAAALGFDVTNGHGKEEHISWAYNAMSTLKSACK